MLLKKEVQVECFSHQTVFYIKSVQVKPSFILQFNLNASGIILNCTTISVLFIVIVSTSTPQKSNTFGFWKTQFFLFIIMLFRNFIKGIQTGSNYLYIHLI